MAAIDTHADVAERNSILGKFWDSIKLGFSEYARARSRSDKIEALQAKSDEELAQLGISRQDIPRYVFQDLVAY